MANSEQLAGCYGPMRRLGSKMGATLEAVVPAAHIDGTKLIPADYLEDLTEFFMVAFAEAIQAWIDAGSEREVTMENEKLHDAIHEELKSWSTQPDPT